MIKATGILFNGGTYTRVNIWTVKGDIHQRINQRFELLEIKKFIQNHPLWRKGLTFKKEPFGFKRN